MRRIIRPWMVVVFSLAATLLLMIGYGNRHPNSAIGQSVQIASHIGSHYILRRTDAAEEAALDDGYSANNETLTAPEEPEPVPAEPEAAPDTAPASAYPAEDGATAIKAAPGLEANTKKSELPLLVCGPLPSEIIPPAMLASADESLQERYRVMPTCEDENEKSPLLMPYASDADQGPRTATCAKRAIEDSKSRTDLDCPAKSRLKGAKTVPTIPGSHGTLCKPADRAQTGGSEEQEMIAPLATGGIERIQIIIQRHAREIFSPGLRQKDGGGRPSTDTLEFRPSDAREGEFEPVQF
jgi:hypothetical protein